VGCYGQLRCADGMHEKADTCVGRSSIISSYRRSGLRAIRVNHHLHLSVNGSEIGCVQFTLEWYFS
jgi:hypothetical protein